MLPTYEAMRATFRLYRSKWQRSCALLLAMNGLMGIAAATADACPFCAAVSQTFSEEIESMDVVVIATIEHAPQIPDSDLADPNAELPKAKFKIKEVIKGEQWVDNAKPIEVLYFGEDDRDSEFLMMGTDPPNLMWSTPLAISERVHDYILKAIEQPKGHERLVFFQEFLEDKDEMLARDAYDEFAKIPYAGVIALKENMHRDRLIGWIKDTEIPASRRRLYYTMLGVCGTAKDAPLLEEMMRSTDRKVKAGLDAMIACYLILRPEKGLPVVEELFLKSEKAEYADTYAAIMAIRFHGSETDVIPRKKLVKSLRHMLDRPELADLVIPDLARWEDWEVMPKLVQLFKSADDKSSWVRVPVVNYLRACPSPDAQTHLKELEQIDPDAVKRAHTFFPFKPESDAAKEEQGSGAASDAAANQESQTNEVAVLALADPAVEVNLSRPAEGTSDELVTETEQGQLKVPDSDGKPADVIPSTETGVDDGSAAEAETDTVSPANSADSNSTAAVATTGGALLPANAPNLLLLLGVPLIAGVFLLLLMRFVLGLPRRDPA